MAQKISKVVGIDLGTTNSVIAMMGPDNKTIICNTDAQKRRTSPSVIVWDKKSQSIIGGQKAFNRRGTKPEPVTSIKRRMGDNNYRVKVGESEMSPIEVSAEILRDLKVKMQEYLKSQSGCEDYIVDRAIVTIPANFRAEAAENTAKAGELAGLEIIRTLQEPSSSSAYYCWKNGLEDGIFMVYDLGGGTFDVSIVRYASGMADVVAISGHNYLGGDTFDELLARMLLENLQDEYELDLDLSTENDMLIFTKLKLVAEVIKKAVSSQDEYFYSQDGAFQDQNGAQVNISVTVTKKEFEDLIEPTVLGTLEKCKEALSEAEKAGVTLDMIDGVLLVGGSTHIPYIREFVRKNFCDPSLELHTINSEPLCDEPDMAVGFGAAVAASAGYSEITYSGDSGETETAEPVLFVEVQPPIGIAGKSNILGKVNVKNGTLPANMQANVSKADGSYSSAFPVDTDGTFKFGKLPAPSEDEPYHCDITAGGETITSFGFNAAASIIQAPPTTLSHTIFVELNDENNKRYLHPLMEKGTNLPASCEHKFRTSSEYSAKVRIFEENTHLCDIVLSFENSVPVNSPVEIRLQIDEKSTKHVNASAGGESQHVVMEAPEIKPPSESELREKLSDFDAVLNVASPQSQILGKALKQGSLRQQADEIKQAIAENDNVRAREAFDELTKNIDGFIKESGDLSPAESVFMRLAEDCMNLIRQHHESDPEKINKTNAYKNAAAECYAQRDQEALTKVYSDLQDWANFVRPAPENDKQPPQWMIVHIFCQEIEKLMKIADENGELQKALSVRKEAESEKPGDLAYMKSCKSNAQPWTTDEEAAQMQIKLRPIMERWKEYAEFTDIIR
ncbi:MAG: Hsp70 family protein [Oscillospiraceae bacterium]|nr:Hsp70 family protein [Oscillospiraceae bacterium]